MNILGKHSIQIVLMVSLFTPLKSQTWDWVKTYGYGTYCTEDGTDIGVDQNGAVYVKEETTCISTGANSSINVSDLLIKYDSAGNFIWKVNCIQGVAATDSVGHTYIAGFDQICMIDSTGNTMWTTNLPSRYFTSIALHPQGGIVAAGYVPYADCSSVIYRVDENGNILWNKVGDYGCPYTMNTDKNGSSYLLISDRIAVYNNYGNIVKEIPVPNTIYTHILVDKELAIYTISRLHAYPNYTMTINNYSPQGGLNWSKTMVAKHGGITCATIDQANNLILAGGFWDNMNYDNLIYSFAKSMFIMATDNSGSMQWIKNNLSSDQKITIGMITSGNNIFVTGRIFGNHNFDQTTVVAEEDMFDMFVAKLNMPTTISSIPEKENILANHLNTYPSPSDGIFYADLSAEADGKLTISNTIGQTVYSESSKSAGNFKSRIDLSSQPKGLYILKCETDKGTFTKKIVIQ